MGAGVAGKAPLVAAAGHAGGGDYEWPRASARRDYMINRELIDWPSDASHVSSLEGAGAVTIRGTARITGPGTIVVSADAHQRALRAHHHVIAVGSSPPLPSLDGTEPTTP